MAAGETSRKASFRRLPDAIGAYAWGSLVLERDAHPPKSTHVLPNNRRVKPTRGPYRGTEPPTNQGYPISVIDLTSQTVDVIQSTIRVL